MLTALESNTAPECECGILFRKDRDMCPVHGTKAHEAKAPETQTPRRVSVGRTQPLYEEPSESTALDEIEQMVEQAYFYGRITWQQRSLFRWAARKAREAESATRSSRCAQNILGVEEL
jgi:uncharacterized Zn finger protein (UPF0148 family)